MPTKVIVPQLGEGVEEVTIVNWLKAEGETVEEYEGLVEVETDKVVTEIPSPANGTILKIEVPNQANPSRHQGVIPNQSNPFQQPLKNPPSQKLDPRSANSFLLRLLRRSPHPHPQAGLRG
jgi:hypothetical protein